MGVIERSMRLLETEQAGLGVWLAALMVLAAIVAVLLGRGPETLLGKRLSAAPRVSVVLAAGVIGAISVVNVSYVAWHRHRCILNHSDIPECVVATTAPDH